MSNNGSSNVFIGSFTKTYSRIVMAISLQMSKISIPYFQQQIRKSQSGNCGF